MRERSETVGYRILSTDLRLGHKFGHTGHKIVALSRLLLRRQPITNKEFNLSEHMH